MAVIINEFEVVVDEPQEEPEPGREREMTSPLPALVPLDVVDVVRRHRERLARLHAH